MVWDRFHQISASPFAVVQLTVRISSVLLERGTYLDPHTKYLVWGLTYTPWGYIVGFLCPAAPHEPLPPGSTV